MNSFELDMKIAQLNKQYGISVNKNSDKKKKVRK